MDAVLEFLKAIAPYAFLLGITFFSIIALLRSNREGRSSASGMSGAFGVMDELFNPAAERSRTERDAQHERVVPMPGAGSPDDKDGEIVIEIKPPRNVD